MFPSLRIERTAVKFEESPSMACCQHYCFDVKVFGCAVARMRDDVYSWILDGSKEGGCVLFASAVGVAELVQACDDVVHAVQRFAICDVNIPFVVDDVQFGSEKQAHIAVLPWDNVLIAEIDGRAGSWNGWSMFGDAKYCKVLLLCFGYHLVECAESVARNNGVSMDVKFDVCHFFLH